MVASSLALLVVVPMQLAGAAGVELAGGYDSTVLNQRPPQTYGDGILTRGAVDLQLGYRGDTVRQLLRTRAEYYYSTGEGRSFDEGDYVSLTRYALRIEPDDTWQIELEASYALGQSSLLLGRGGGSAYLNFQRGIYGDLTVQAQAQHNFTERFRAGLVGGVLSRHAVDIPVEVVRNNMLTFVSAIETAYDVNDENVVLAAARGEYFLIDGYLNWVPRIVGYAGLRHLFGENTILTLLGGVDSLADQNDTSDFFVGPYANAALSVALPDEHLVLGLGARYEYAIVATTRCAINTGGVCPANQVIGGGTGRVLGSNFSLLWRPGEGRVAFTGDVTADYGVTESAVPGRAGATREIPSLNLSALAGVRFSFNRQVSAFARYNFLFSNVDLDGPAQSRGVINEIVRHVALVGVTFAIGTEDDGVTEPMVPFEEIEAMQDAHAAGGSSAGGAGAAGDPLTSDPFDLVSADAASSQAGEAGSGWLTPTTSADDPDAPPADPNAPPPPPPRTATQPSTHGTTQRSTSPVNHGSTPAAPNAPTSGGVQGDTGPAPQGESNP